VAEVSTLLLFCLLPPVWAAEETNGEYWEWHPLDAGLRNMSRLWSELSKSVHLL